MQKNRSWKGTILLKNRKYKRTFLHRIWICHWVHSKRSQIYKRITLNRNWKSIKLAKVRSAKESKMQKNQFWKNFSLYKNQNAKEPLCARIELAGGHSYIVKLQDSKMQKTFTLKKGTRSAQKRKYKKILYAETELTKE